MLQVQEKEDSIDSSVFLTVLYQLIRLQRANLIEIPSLNYHDCPLVITQESGYHIHCKKLKVVLTLLWLFELQLEYTIATAGKCFRDKHRAMSNLASENHHPLMI